MKLNLCYKAQETRSCKKFEKTSIYIHSQKQEILFETELLLSTSHPIELLRYLESKPMKICQTSTSRVIYSITYFWLPLWERDLLSTIFCCRFGATPKKPANIKENTKPRKKKNPNFKKQNIWFGERLQRGGKRIKKELKSVENSLK